MNTLSLEEQEKGMEKLRNTLGSNKAMNPKSEKDNIERIKCSEAQFFPKVPNFWVESKMSIYHLLSSDASDYIKIYDYKGLHVIVSVAKYRDGKEWLHVSFSRTNRIPSYDDVQLVRNSFIGEDKKAIMVFPEKEHYVNIAKNCLHLWYSKDNDIPDFDIELFGKRSI